MGNLLRAVVVLSLVPVTARAESTEVYMELHGTTLDVKVVGAPLPPANELELAAVDGDWSHRVPALNVHSYAEGNEPISIMFLVSGQEVWMGNELIEVDPDVRIPGAIGPLEAAIDALDLSRRVPPGSQAGIVTYATGAEVRMPLSPIGQLHGTALGTQHDYHGKIGSDLTAGISTALGQLERATTPRKMLIVIGDGNDSDGIAAAVDLAELKKRAAIDKIELYGLVYKSRFSADTTSLTQMIPATAAVASTDRFADELEWIVQRATRRFYAQFDVRSLPVWDGKDHDLTLRINWEDQDPVTIAFPKKSELPPWWRSTWLQVLFGLFGVGTLALLARRVR